MKLFYCLFSSLIMGFTLTAQQVVNHNFEYDGEIREYLVYLPPSYVEGMSLPLVLNFHGFGSTATEQAFYSNFSAIADTANFIVVYPQGLFRNIIAGGSGNHWNAHFGTDVDDLGFINRLIDYLYTDYNIDLKRVYATGMSNGGYMSYHLACELSDRIAAIASVTGAMVATQEMNCPIERPIPLMQIHGTADDVVPYNGAPPLQASIPDIVDFWVSQNACSLPPTEVEVADINTSDNSMASYQHYFCDAGTEVIFYTIENGGHSWPGAIPLAQLGVTNQDFNASEVIWAFFNRHSHPNPTTGTIVSSNKDISGQENVVKVVPNPFSETIQLSFQVATPKRLQIYDALGQLVLYKEQKEIQPQMTISLDGFPKGFYTLVVFSEEGKIVRTLLKE